MAIAQNNIIMCCLFFMFSDWNVPLSRDREDEDEEDFGSPSNREFVLPSVQQGELDFQKFPAVNNDTMSDFDIPGYKFIPNDQDLILGYLRNCIMGLALPHSTTIRQIELYNYDPDELPIGKSRRFLKNELYFFTRNEAAYAEEKVPRLGTKTGEWRSNGNDEKICVEDLLVGFKRAYIFYRGKEHEADKTHWTMHEYRINPRILPEDFRTKMESFVVCKIILDDDEEEE